MSTEAESSEFYRKWDWLPEAAKEVQAYIQRMLDEAAITAHDVSARAKSIESFQRKRNRKNYTDPIQQVTDTVAVRIITYSVTDRDRVAQLIRDRFNCHEDRNPGAEKDSRRRGYDCHHFVVTGESPGADTGWLIAGGKLTEYFNTFGGLEIQIRTVAAHSWAEFEHSRRYKGELYSAVSDEDKETVDYLFGAASDARRALDEAFRVIDRVLASPSAADEFEQQDHRTPPVQERDAPPSAGQLGSDQVNHENLRDYLAEKYPEGNDASREGINFATEILACMEIESLDNLDSILAAVDGTSVRTLMGTPQTATRVRLMDDDLLANFGESYIDATSDAGNVKSRRQQLESRYDRLRGKVKYNQYTITGNDCPEGIRDTLLPAARAVRELTRIIAINQGVETVSLEDAISSSHDELPKSARPKKLENMGTSELWVATNLNREYSESIMRDLLARPHGLDIHVKRGGVDIRREW